MTDLQKIDEAGQMWVPVHGRDETYWVEITKKSARELIRRSAKQKNALEVTLSSVGNQYLGYDGYLEVKA